MIKVIDGGITAAKGFTAAGVHCGIKAGKKDLALVVSECPAATAAMFTTNKVAAAPVVFDKEQLQKSPLTSAIIANSGIANACTGERGMQDCQTMAQKTADVLSVPVEQILVASTGVIGHYLFIDKIKKGIKLAASELSPEKHLDAEIAIMTTDTRPKEYAVEVATDEGNFRIGGMTKGSGMIKPNMATMLTFLTTDADVAPEHLDFALRQAVEHSFNRISVDNDTSTNDTTAILANGKSGVKEIVPTSPLYAEFCEALQTVCIELAKMLVKDGEGTTKLIEIQVNNAANDSDALQGARAIADSYLVKTAMYGEDPNWGRIMCALGYAGIELVPEKIQLRLNSVPILQTNFEQPTSRVDARKALEAEEVLISVDLGLGNSSATVWTSDLSHEYVDINAKYTT
ncbi:bifunctional ornithine acetyltransferase/N-acetylglutamate synthase [candidate division KSB3 bacterium]|uniref:Arginine biosynthesis bifunctional protein ArgJ n=1 Tax=candidate division KSB3 bacterium TaxID=2044937 RepID=A0A2G6KIU6_9BACT|nr:MAG: bifunctional ornithine acetyltransferase/N-acetylglutamate synthase [candidate division KSB3 bacterium]